MTLVSCTVVRPSLTIVPPSFVTRPVGLSLSRRCDGRGFGPPAALADGRRFITCGEMVVFFLVGFDLWGGFGVRVIEWRIGCGWIHQQGTFYWGSRISSWIRLEEENEFEG